jgi:hypothetical protein
MLGVSSRSFFLGKKSMVFFGLPGWFLWRAFRRRILVRRVPEPSPIPSE